MNRTKLFMGILVILAVLLTGTLTFAQSSASNVYTIVFRGNGIPSNAADLVAAAGGELVATLPEVGIGMAVSSDVNFAANANGIRGISGASTMGVHALPDTQFSIDATAPNPAVDNLYGLQWTLRRVNADDAWAAGYTGSHDTVVAILDTGIAAHPDLDPNVVFRTCYSVFQGANCYPISGDHGTHVAGTVGAVFEGGRVVGVAPNIALASYNVFELDSNGGGAYDFALFSAIVDVANQGFDVINMSLGGYIVRADGAEAQADITAWNRVVNYALKEGVVIVASSGNGDSDLNGPLFHIPGDLPGIINVGSTSIRPAPAYPQADSYDVRAWYSNYGAPVTVVGPGGDVGPYYPDGDPVQIIWEYATLSTFLFYDEVCAADNSCPPGYAWSIGTSMSSPHVAGVAALVRDANPGLSQNQVESILKRTAENLGDRQLFGHGMVDAFEAVTTADK